LSYGPAPDAEGVFGRKLAEEWIVGVARPDAPDRRIAVGEAAELRVADAGAALDLALAGLGTALVPLTLANAALLDGRLEERGARIACEDAFWLCAPAPQWKAAKVKALVAALTED
jgi:LysR family glycine cleavage system transcriptional activator